jgi:MFS family permease
LHAPLVKPSLRSRRGLDWFVFFVADVLTGFGPFIAIHLTAQKWTQLDIGLVLTVGGLVALLGQMPGGALVDWAKSERFVAAVSIGLVGACAFALGACPIYPVVQGAVVVQALAVCVLGPAIAAISLGLVGHPAVGERLGRNARFSSLGAGVAALAMGAVGYFITNQAVFFVTAAFALPAIIAISVVRDEEIDPERAHGGFEDEEPDKPHHCAPLRSLLLRRPLLIFGACVVLFQLANAAMLPLMGTVLTMRSAQWATPLIAACMVVPQLVVAAVSPWVGRRAQEHGRRPLLLLGFAMVPIRALLFALVTVADPWWVVVAQVFDGVAAAVFSVMVPFVVADLARGSGRFNLTLGTIGTATGIGASISTTLAGYVSDHFGSAWAFLGLAGIGLAGLALVFALMPETGGPTPARQMR